MFAGIAGTGVTPLQAASPLQSVLLIVGMGAGLVLILAHLSPNRTQSVSHVAGFVAVAMFLALGGTLGTTMTWLQAAFVFHGVVVTIWAVRDATKERAQSEPEGMGL